MADAATHVGQTPETARARPARLNWEDPFLIDDQLTDEERMIRDSAAAVVPAPPWCTTAAMWGNNHARSGRAHV